MRRFALKPQVAIACAFSVSLFCATLYGQDMSRFDLSTDEGVNAAREAIAGQPLTENSKRCIRRDFNLPGIIVVGVFAYDYGCRLQGAFIKSQYFAVDDKEFSRRALEAAGWKTVNQQQKENLAKAWVAKKSP